jgi:hypothetical protein
VTQLSLGVYILNSDNNSIDNGFRIPKINLMRDSTEKYMVLETLTTMITTSRATKLTHSFTSTRIIPAMSTSVAKTVLKISQHRLRLSTRVEIIIMLGQLIRCIIRTQVLHKVCLIQPQTAHTTSAFHILARFRDQVALVL